MVIVRRSRLRPRPVVGTYLCPLCNHFAKTEVKDSRPNPMGYVNRRRYCNECKGNFSTVEIPAELLKAVDLTALSAVAAEALTNAVAKFNALRNAIRQAAEL